MTLVKTISLSGMTFSSYKNQLGLTNLNDADYAIIVRLRDLHTYAQVNKKCYHQTWASRRLAINSV